MEDTQERGAQVLIGVASEGPTKYLKRLALVVRDSRASHAVAALRASVDTFAIASLSELRLALTEQHVYHEESQTWGKNLKESAVTALDLTRLPLEDTALFASGLKTASHLGEVYVLTPDQFELFEEGTFDFVVR
jgi:hypothetical protein